MTVTRLIQKLGSSHRKFYPTAMPLFSYRATDPTGSLQQGSIDAVNVDAARAVLGQKGWTPLDVTPVASEPFHVAPSQIPQPQQTTQPSPMNEHDVGSQTLTPTITPKVYLPIAATLRLYAGWLLAYYAIVYAVGWYAHSRPLPFEIPYVEALLLSPLVLSFTFAAFLFLLFHTLYRAMGAGLWKGIFLTMVGVGAFVVYRMNVA